MSLSRCPYCNAYLIPYSEAEGKYTCPGCGRSFHMENDRLKNSTLKNVFGLKQRLRNAEKAYDEAFRLLSHLDSEENRKFLADVLNRAGYGNIKPNDFEGAKLIQHQKGGDLFNKRYGFRVYPITILIAYEKSDEVMQKFQSDPNFRYGGVDVHVEDLPFAALGGIRLEFPKTSGSFTAEHEDFHGTFEIYRKGRGKYSDIADGIEEKLLDEINSFRHEIISMCTKEYGGLDRKTLEDYWNGEMKDKLLGYYLPLYIKKIEKRYNEREREEIKRRVKNDLEEAIPVFVELQLRYHESVLSKILLKSRTLNDIVLWWRLRKNILDQWQERAVRAIGKELEDMKKEEEASGREKAEGIGKDLEELDEEEDKEDAEEAKAIGDELDEI